MASRTTRVASNLQDLSIFDFMLKASPEIRGVKTTRPDHLASVLPFFDAIEREPTTFCFSAPPRHGKSILTNHLVARHMLRHPGVKIAYGSYSLDLSADWFSGEVKDIFLNNNIPINRTSNTKEYWELENGSSFKAIAPGSGFTGRGADLIIIDDPYKNRETASSGAVRASTWDWISDVCFTRRSPNASILITHTRWNYEDIIGVMEREHGFPYINLPAINELGEALWPEQWPADRLAEVRKVVGEYKWASLYMGQPIPQGGAVFRGTNLYTVE
jgi:hypothetical protein